MFAVYADESGKHLEAKHFVIAGLRVSGRSYARLSAKWEAALQESGIPAFHATDCEAGKGNIFGSMNRVAREAIQDRLIKVITAERDLAVGLFSIPRKLYPAAVSTIGSRKYRSSPYFLLFQSFIIEMLQFRNSHAHRVSFFFQRQDEFGAEAQRIYDRMKSEPSELQPRMGALLFPSKADQEAIILQAADLIAYEGYKRLSEPTGTRARWQARALFPPLGKRLSTKDWNRESIQLLLDKHAGGGSK